MERSGRWLLGLATGGALLGIPWLVLPGLDMTPQGPWWHVLPLWLILGAADPASVPKEVLLHVVAALGVVAACCLPLRRLDRRLLLGLGALLAWLLLAVVLCPQPLLSLPLWISILAAVALMVVFSTGWSPQWQAGAGRCACLGAVGVAVYGLAQHLHLDPCLWNHPDMVFGRTISTCGNPNFLAHYEVTVLPWVVMLTAMATSRTGRGLGLVAMGLVLASLGVTQTRASVLSLLVSIVVLGWLLRPLQPSAWLRATLGLFLVGSLLVTAWTVLLRPVDPEETNAATRIYLWKVAVRLVAAHPLVGVGPGLFPYAALSHRDIEPVAIRHRQALAEDPHNVYLSVAASAGLPALVLLLGLLALSTRPTSPPTWDRAAAGASWTAFWINGFFVYPTLPASAVAIFSLAALTADPSQVGSYRLPRWLLGLSLGVLALATVAAGATLHALFENKYAEELSDQAGVDSQAWQAVTDIGQRAAQRTPWNHPLASRLQVAESQLLATWFARTRATEVAQRAIESFQTSIHLNPLDPYPRMALGRLLADIGLAVGEPFLSAAFQAESQAIALDPDNPVFRVERGTLLARVGRLDEAEADLQRAWQIYPHGLDALLPLAHLHERRHDTSGARQYAAEALRQDRTSAAAAEIYRRLKPP